MQLQLFAPEALSGLVAKLAHCTVETDAAKPQNAATFIVGTTEYSVPLDKFVNVEEELGKLQADLLHQEGFLRGVMAKLNNERFVQNAKPEVVELERKKQRDAMARIATLKENIAALQK